VPTAAADGEKTDAAEPTAPADPAAIPAATEVKEGGEPEGTRTERPEDPDDKVCGCGYGCLAGGRR
jgi:hypothetical protein